jgi:hypothetical protein
MTTATLQFNHPTLFKDGRFARDDPPPKPEPASATPRRLDEVLSAAWNGLAAHHSVTCPVCSGSMAPRYGSGAQPVGGRCTRCGSTLG